MKDANLALRFVLELCALAALGYWGATVGGHPLTQVGLAVGAPLLAAVAWGVFVSPKASVDNVALRGVVELAVFGAAGAGLAAVGRVGLAASLLTVFAFNRVLLEVWDQ